MFLVCYFLSQHEHYLKRLSFFTMYLEKVIEIYFNLLFHKIRYSALYSKTFKHLVLVISYLVLYFTFNELFHIDQHQLVPDR